MSLIQRVTQDIQRMPDGRWRIVISLDGYNVLKAYSDISYEDACAKAAVMVAKVKAEAGIND